MTIKGVFLQIVYNLEHLYQCSLKISQEISLEIIQGDFKFPCPFLLKFQNQKFIYCRKDTEEICKFLEDFNIS